MAVFQIVVGQNKWNGVIENCEMHVRMYVWTWKNTYFIYIYVKILHSFYRKDLKIVYKPVLSLQALPQACVISMLCLEFEDSMYQKCWCSPCREDLCWERLDRKGWCISRVNQTNSWQITCFSWWFTYQWICFLLVWLCFFPPQPLCCVELLKCCLYYYNQQ